MSKSLSQVRTALAEPWQAPAASAPASRAALDLVHLARQSLGDKDRETEILALFDQQAGQAMGRLGALSGRDFGLAADLARMLASSARTAGAFGVASAATVYEAVVLSSLDGDGGEAACDHLVAEVVRVRAVIAELLGR